MSKLKIATTLVCIGLSTAAMADASTILGAALLISALGGHSHREVVVIPPPPQYRAHEHRYQPTIVEPNYNYQPPTYSPSTQIFTYTPPMVYDTYSGQWIPQAKIYVPASKHFAGCNFYVHEEAWACIRYKESLLNGTYGR